MLTQAGLTAARADFRRWSGGRTLQKPDRYGHITESHRWLYHNHSERTNFTYTEFSVTRLVLLKHQREFKYTFNVDGTGCSTRFQKVLATGQVGMLRRPQPGRTRC